MNPKDNRISTPPGLGKQKYTISITQRLMLYTASLPKFVAPLRRHPITQAYARVQENAKLAGKCAKKPARRNFYQCRRHHCSLWCAGLPRPWPKLPLDWH